MTQARAYYNEIDPFAAAWLRELIRAKEIPDGDVDERSIEDVSPNDLLGYRQCHFFAGIGGWPLAFRLAGWPDDREAWTGSCPCQPFSAAGKGKGFADERHLWPAFHWHIEQCSPLVVFGEQVAGKDGLGWLDLVSSDLEAMGYTCGAVPFPAAGIGAPHIRERLYWVADATESRWPGERRSSATQDQRASERGHVGRLEHTQSDGRQQRRAEPSGGSIVGGRGAGGLADANGGQRIGISDGQERQPHWAATGWKQSYSQPQCNGETLRPGPVNSHWRNADWLGCRDDRWRPVEPGTFPLADGVPARVGRLRGHPLPHNPGCCTLADGRDGAGDGRMRQGVRGIIRLKGLWVHREKAFYRTRKGGKVKLVPLPDLPHDHPDFIAAWAEAARGGKPAEKPKAGSLASTWNALKASDMFRSWTPVYQAKIARQFNAICATKGHVAARVIRDPHITKDVAEAPSPGDRLRAWRAWGAWCKERGIITENPAPTVKMPRMTKPKGEIGHRRWTADELEQFRARWAIGTSPRAMMELLLWTGVRISDAVRIGPQMIDAGGVLVVTQRKTGEKAYIPWTCALPAYADESDRRMMLDAIRPFAGQLCFLPARGEKPRSDKAAVQMMLKACTSAGIGATAHGLRKTRAALIIEGGGTSSQSAAWTGHQSLKLAQHYQREFDRRAAVMGITPDENERGADIGYR